MTQMKFYCKPNYSLKFEGKKYSFQTGEVFIDNPRLVEHLKNEAGFSYNQEDYDNFVNSLKHESNKIEENQREKRLLKSKVINYGISSWN